MALKEHNKLRVGTGRATPTKFEPPRLGVDMPQSLFAPSVSVKETPRPHEFIRRTNNHTQYLDYASGTCLDNGRANPTAGCSVVFGSSTPQANAI